MLNFTQEVVVNLQDLLVLTLNLMAKEGREALLRLPSGELRKVKNNCRATIGQVGNLEHEQINIGKAGKTDIEVSDQLLEVLR